MFGKFISTRFKPILVAMTLAIVPAYVVSAPVASAQGVSVVVFDQERVMRESRAGQDIVTKLKAMGQTTESQLKPENDSLEGRRSSLETRTQGMTEQAIVADPALRGEVEAYARDAGNYAQKVRKIGQELSLTERAAWSEFFKALEPVLQEVANERGAQLMLERSSAVIVSPNLDVTALVIQKLDARTPSINVVRQTIPAQ